MKKFTWFIILFCIQFNAVNAQKNAPTWIDKKKKAVFTIETFDKDGKKLKTGNAFFTHESGIAASDYNLFKNASKAIAKTNDGKEFAITTILGANELYDVIKFKVDIPKKGAFLEVSSQQPVNETKAYLLPFGVDKDKSFIEGRVLETSKIKEGLNYYKMELPLESKNISAPVLNENGELIGISQADASKDKNKSYVLPVQFINKLTILPTDAFNSTYSSIGIRKAWPEKVEDALTYLFLCGTNKDPKSGLETITDFIKTFPEASEGYTTRATHLSMFRKQLASQPGEESKILNFSKEDLKTAEKLSKNKSDAILNNAKLIFETAASDSTLKDSFWNINNALTLVQNLNKGNEVTVAKLLEADINMYLKNFELAYNMYMDVNKTALASSASFFSAAKAKEQNPDSKPEEIIALLDSAIVKFGNNPSAEAAPYVLERIELKMFSEKYKEAAADYDLYFKLLNGQVADAFYYFREQARFRSGDLKGSMNDINEAIRRDPNNAIYHAEQASIFIRLNDYVKAQIGIKKALAIQPEFAACYRLAGICAIRQGNKAEACEAFQKAKSLGDTVVDKLIQENCK